MPIATNNYIIGGSGFIGCLLAMLVVSKFSRRAVLIGGYLFIMIGHFLIFIFI